MEGVHYPSVLTPRSVSAPPSRADGHCRVEGEILSCKAQDQGVQVFRHRTPSPGCGLETDAFVSKVPIDDPRRKGVGGRQPGVGS